MSLCCPQLLNSYPRPQALAILHGKLKPDIYIICIKRKETYTVTSLSLFSDINVTALGLYLTLFLFAKFENIDRVYIYLLDSIRG